VREASARGPVLLVGNHTSWWDALVCFYLLRGYFYLETYALMDAKNLKKLPFFSFLGAFGVDRSDPLDGARGLRYAAKQLRRAGVCVLMFPQGRERPVTERPLGFYPGAAALAQLAPVSTVVPFALRYEWGEDEKPTIYVNFGSALEPASVVVDGQRAQEQAVTRALDAIDTALCTDCLDDFVSVLTARRPSWWATLAVTWLVWLSTRYQPGSTGRRQRKAR